MLTCEESQRAFSPYLDGELTRAEGAALAEHLGVCPVCRLGMERTREMIRGLSLVARPAAPADLASSINHAVMGERAARRALGTRPVGERFARWLEPHLMPYAVGAFYSVLLFIVVFGALRSQMEALRNMAYAERLTAEVPYRVTWVNGVYGVTRANTTSGAYAASRSPYGGESPTLNPSGALAALATSPSSGGQPEDDDMIVVADVYSNGSASLAAVVEPPRNRRVLTDLEDAFRKSPAFVPAALDGRPETMRVVFVYQRMNVADSSY